MSVLCAKKRRAYLVRVPDGALLDGAKYRSFNALVKKRTADREKLKKYYNENKATVNKARIARRKKNEEKENERKRQWYYLNHERERFNEIQRRIKRNPHRIINNALSEYRSNHITLDELDRLVNDAISKTDEIYNGINCQRGKPV